MDGRRLAFGNALGKWRPLAFTNGQVNHVFLDRVTPSSIHVTDQWIEIGRHGVDTVVDIAGDGGGDRDRAAVLVLVVVSVVVASGIIVLRLGFLGCSHSGSGRRSGLLGLVVESSFASGHGAS